MPSYNLSATPAADPDLSVEEVETLAELSQELAALAEEPGLHVDLRDPGGRWPLADLAAAVREGLRERSGEVHLYLPSERAVEAARALLLAPGPRPPRAFRFGRVQVEVRDADLVRVEAEALVNASNRQLRLGGGVSGALRRACGEELQRALDRIGGLEGEPLVETSAFALTTARRILHVPTVSGAAGDVGPAYEAVLRRCLARRYASVGLPLLGAGSGGMPLARSAALLREAVERVAADAPADLRVIVALLAGRGRAEVEAALEEDGGPGAARRP